MIVESDAEVVRRIYGEYEKGISAKCLCDKLNREGIKSPQGSRWTTPRLLYILGNERYAGDVVTNKYYVKNQEAKRKHDRELEEMRRAIR